MQEQHHSDGRVSCWANRVLRCQAVLLYKKNMRVSTATNKSISTGKFLIIMLSTRHE